MDAVGQPTNGTSSNTGSQLARNVGAARNISVKRRAAREMDSATAWSPAGGEMDLNVQIFHDRNKKKYLEGRTVLKGYIVTKKSIIQTKLGLLINFSILYMNGAT